MQNGPLVFRAPSGIPGVVGPVTLVIIPNENLSNAPFEGLDYEATYILESSIFGHEDYGRLTFTLNGTWLSRATFNPGNARLRLNTKPFGLAGYFILGNSFPWNRANFTLYYDGPPDTWMQSLDAGAVVHWIGQYNDDNAALTQSPKLNMPRTGGLNNPAQYPFRARKASAWTTLDLIASYTFNLPRLAPPAPMPGFAKDGGKTVKVKAFRLGEALDWAAAQARVKGFERVAVACEPTGPRWMQVQRLCAERGLPLVCIQPLVSHIAREQQDYTTHKTDESDCVLIARLAAEQKIAHAAADPEGLETGVLEKADDFGGNVAQRAGRGSAHYWVRRYKHLRI